MNLFIEQTLNGLQLGFTLLMVSAGLTLIFGIMNIINLAHGSAFVAADVGGRTGNYLLALLAGIAGAAVAGLIVELGLIRRLYHRDHLYQVLATFALVLIANQAVQMIWGSTPRSVAAPEFLDRTVTVLPGLPYPAYRLAITATGIAVIVFLHLLVERTRVGMWIRAGRTHRELLGAFGVNVRLLYTLVFAVGAGLAGLAGVVAAPFLSVESGIGDHFLILSFVVIVVGGIGSLKGALYGSLMLGRTYLPDLFGRFVDPSTAATAGASVASASIYLVMVVVLVVKPNGLFGLADE
ncbi:MAG: branched-chain amino acid ABC transporter permease [Acidimicrobiia bacterium]|nr:branched-chain amino acid ABC transporter permease [Acidimicrobiia bacterium]